MGARVDPTAPATVREAREGPDLLESYRSCDLSRELPEWLRATAPDLAAALLDDNAYLEAASRAMAGAIVESHSQLRAFLARKKADRSQSVLLDLQRLVAAVADLKRIGTGKLDPRVVAALGPLVRTLLGLRDDARPRDQGPPVPGAEGAVREMGEIGVTLRGLRDGE
jgi:hypothetical protein